MHSDDFLRGWLQGFFDGEGGAYLSRYGKRQATVCKIRVSNTEKALIDFASAALDRLRIGHRVYCAKNRGTKSGKYYSVVIHRQLEVRKFIEQIGLVTPRKIERTEAMLAWINRPPEQRKQANRRLGRFVSGRRELP